MSDKSPFTLVRPVAAESANNTPPVQAAPPKVVLPTRRKNIPQATEPVLLTSSKPDSGVDDVLARVKKAAVAPPLEMTPRPARAERKELAKQVLDQAPPAPSAQLGATVLPPPKKHKISDPLANPVESDPFETNASALATVTPQEIGRIIAPSSEEAPEAAPSSPKIQRSKAAAATMKEGRSAPEVPLTPRHVSAAKEFLAETVRPVEAAAPTPLTPASIFRKATKTQLPSPKKNFQNSVQADLHGWLEADGLAVKNHTPRSDAPIEEVPMKSEAAPLVSNSRIKFCCPACNHTISMVKRLAGQKTRCPQCASAIRAPHPRHQRGAYNYENHIEAFLHADRFALPAASRPRFMGIPLPEVHAAIIGSAAAMLVGGGVALTHLSKQPTVLENQALHKAEAMPTDPNEPDLKKEDPFAIQESAKQLVKSYLEADGLDKKIQFVREPERVTPLMKDYFSRGNNDQPLTVAKMHCSTPGYYQSQDLKQRRSNVLAELSDGRQMTFFVEYLPGGPKIEWESSVAYSPTDWHDIINAKPDKKFTPQLLRVTACVDKYYNDSQFKENTHLCVYLQDPVTNEPLGNGYIPRMSEDGIRLRKFLYGSSKNKPDQIMVEVRPVANSSKERIVEITKFVKSGFRNPEPSAVASSQ